MSKHLNVIKYISNRFAGLRLDANKTNAKINCPFCGDTRYRMYVRLSKPIAHCFNCNYSAKFFKFVTDYENAGSYIETYTILADFMTDEPAIVGAGLSSIGEDKRLVSSMDLPEEFKPITSGFADSYWARQYITSRGFRVEYAALYGIGYCTEGTYQNRVIIPTYKQRELAYFIGRDYTGGSGTRRVLHSETARYPNAVFNLDQASLYPTIFVSEGWADAMSFGTNGTALNGKAINPAQAASIASAKKPVVVVLDSDAVFESVGVAKTILEYGDKVFLVALPEGDPNDLYRKGKLTDCINQNCIELNPGGDKIRPIKTIKGW